MPSHFGEAGEDESHEGPRLKGSIEVHAGEVVKSVQQMLEGEQSETLEALAKEILALCRSAAQKGTGASSLAEGLDKLASRALAPETLQVILQRRAEGAQKASQETTWVLDMEGRRVTDQLLPAGQTPPPLRVFVLSDADFLGLVRLLAEAHVGEIPINVYEPLYTDLRLGVLNHLRTITGRKFFNMTAETHGEKQKAFDRVYDGFRVLHERVGREGRAVARPAPAPEERDRDEKEKEKEKD